MRSEFDLSAPVESVVAPCLTSINKRRKRTTHDQDRDRLRENATCSVVSKLLLSLRALRHGCLCVCVSVSGVRQTSERNKSTRRFRAVPTRPVDFGIDILKLTLDEPERVGEGAAQRWTTALRTAAAICSKAAYSDEYPSEARRESDGTCITLHIAIQPIIRTRSNTLQDDRARLATTDAGRPDGVPLVEAVQGVHEVVGDPGARRRERVAESCAERIAGSEIRDCNHARERLIKLTDSTTVDVGLFHREAELLLDSEPLSRERLVDVKQLPSVRVPKVSTLARTPWNDRKGGQRRTSMSSILRPAFFRTPRIPSTGPIPADEER